MNPSNKDTGRVFVISAPSGSGKTTLIRYLLERNPHLQFSVSHTTRQPRPGERHGRDYYFVDEKTFRGMIDQQAFIEWAQVHGHYYGTSRAEIQRILKSGHDVILDIDVQGALQIQRRIPEAVFIMIVPPGIDHLKERLIKRGDLSDDQLRLRLENARFELKLVRWFDYRVINEDIQKAVEELDSIIRATHCRIGLMAGFFL